jgi:hypothetical protein
MSSPKASRTFDIIISTKYNSYKINIINTKKQTEGGGSWNRRIKILTDYYIVLWFTIIFPLLLRDGIFSPLLGRML